MTTIAIILEATEGNRRLDLKQSQPLSLDLIDDDKPVLCWIIEALSKQGIDNVTYIGGYHIEKVIQQFPHLNFRYHANRQKEGEVAALLQFTPPPTDNCLIIRADTLLLASSLENLPTHPVTSAIYKSDGINKPLGVYHIRDTALADFFSQASSLVGTQPGANMEDLLDNLPAMGRSVETLDLDGLAAPVKDRHAIARTVFKGKAQTLENLSNMSVGAKVLDIFRFTVADWNDDSNDIVNKITRKFGNRHLIVRSSTINEDSVSISGAGKFLSIPDIASDDCDSVNSAINQVISSYTTSDRDVDIHDEVLIQPQIKDMASCGVLLTRDPQTGAPYFVINIDKESGRGDIVTSGGEGSVETHYISWVSLTSKTIPEHLEKIISLGQELIEISHIDELDIEFGIDSKGVSYLFQVRPLTSIKERLSLSDIDVHGILKNAVNFIADRMRPRYDLSGSTTVLGTMPDWNPAEMIGNTPQPLALSLYQTLIGNKSWAIARAKLGYRDISPEPLILSIGGAPYVDVRTSLNSLLPNDVDPGFSDIWVDACLKRLRDNPHLHDKIEFDIAITCLSPNWDKHLEKLKQAAISDKEINLFKESLRSLTENIITGNVEPVDDQFKQLDLMNLRREKIISDSPIDITGLGRQVKRLINDCCELGIIPFSILARYAFISMEFLRGLREQGALPEDDYDDFLKSIPTIAADLTNDSHAFAKGELTRDDLVKSYGHLRPNSYEITSPDYASDPEHYFSTTINKIQPCIKKSDPLDILNKHKAEIDCILKKLDINVSLEELGIFIINSISGREKAKFEFMKNVNLILETIAKQGELIGMSREQLSFIPVDDFIRMETDSISHATLNNLLRSSFFHEKRWFLTRSIRLPEIIFNPEDVLSFKMEEWQANFITRKRIETHCVWLDSAHSTYDLNGAIVFIRAADPGYDWIFSHNISGLVTQYGGVASHMAIRAAEFGLPAAIGCGSLIFDRLQGAKTVELDCERKTVSAVS